jgi:hypothetical protein
MLGESTQNVNVNAHIEKLHGGLITAILAAKEAETEAQEAECRATIGGLVDSCVLLQTSLNSEIERLAAIVKEFQAEKAKAEESLNLLNSKLLDFLAVNNLKTLSGEKFQLAEASNPVSVAVDYEPSEIDAQAYPDLVRVKYEWSKTSIKSQLESGKDVGFARLVRKKKINYKIRRA